MNDQKKKEGEDFIALSTTSGYWCNMVTMELYEFGNATTTNFCFIFKGEESPV